MNDEQAHIGLRRVRVTRNGDQSETSSSMKGELFVVGVARLEIVNL
jgi:hypothetical protein